jgi:hypothetical protein
MDTKLKVAAKADAYNADWEEVRQSSREREVPKKKTVAHFRAPSMQIARSFRKELGQRKQTSKVNMYICVFR